MTLKERFKDAHRNDRPGLEVEMRKVVSPDRVLLMGDDVGVFVPHRPSPWTSALPGFRVEAVQKALVGFDHPAAVLEEFPAPAHPCQIDREHVPVPAVRSGLMQHELICHVGEKGAVSVFESEDPGGIQGREFDIREAVSPLRTLRVPIGLAHGFAVPHADPEDPSVPRGLLPLSEAEGEDLSVPVGLLEGQEHGRWEPREDVVQLCPFLIRNELRQSGEQRADHHIVSQGVVRGGVPLVGRRPADMVKPVLPLFEHPEVKVRGSLHHRQGGVFEKDPVAGIPEVPEHFHRDLRGGGAVERIIIGSASVPVGHVVDEKAGLLLDLLRVFTEHRDAVSAESVIVFGQFLMSGGKERGVHVLDVVMEIIHPRDVVVIESPEAACEMGRIRASALAVHDVEVQRVDVLEIIVGNRNKRLVPELPPCRGVPFVQGFGSGFLRVSQGGGAVFAGVFGIRPRFYGIKEREGVLCMRSKPAGRRMPVHNGLGFRLLPHKGEAEAEDSGVQLLRDIEPSVLHPRVRTVEADLRSEFLLGIPPPESPASPSGEGNGRSGLILRSGADGQYRNAAVVLGERSDRHAAERSLRVDESHGVNEGQTGGEPLLIKVLKDRRIEPEDDLPGVFHAGQLFFVSGAVAFVIPCHPGRRVLPEIAFVNVDMKSVLFEPEEGTRVPVPDRQSGGRRIDGCPEEKVVPRDPLRHAEIPVHGLRIEMRFHHHDPSVSGSRRPSEKLHRILFRTFDYLFLSFP